MTRKRFSVFATTFDKRGNVIGCGTNSYQKSHPLMKHFAGVAGESDDKIYLHAELAAILAAGKKTPHRIFVQRYFNDGSPADAAPCPTCRAMLDAFGVKLIQYTQTGTDEIGKVSF